MVYEVCISGSITISNNPYFQQLSPQLYILSTMPRVNSNSKQKNKRFKGSNKQAKRSAPLQKKKTKGINKAKQTHKPSKLQRIKQLKEKKGKEVDSLAIKNQYLDQNTKNIVKEKMKQLSQVRIVLVVGCNENADVLGVMKAFADVLGEQEGYVVRKELGGCSGFPAFQVFPAAQRSPIKNRLFIVGSTAETKQLIDLAKCADIICPVISVLAANPQKIVQDPYNYAGAFDDSGYTTINLLRSLGLTRVVGLIQHIQKIQPRQQQKIIKFYKRFFNSEFGQQKIITFQNSVDVTSIFRTFDSIGLLNQAWKKQRGFILADQVQINQNGQVSVSGFLKGSCINPNQLVHVTGLEDFQIQKVEILTMGTRSKLSMEVETSTQQLLQFSTVPEDLNPFAKPESNDDQELLAAIKDLQIQEEEQPQAIQEQMKDSQSDSEADWEQQISQLIEGKQQQRAKRVEMQMRTQDELQFQDEAEYATEQILRQKFREYQGLKSFKTSSWNKLQNLPSQYDRIYFFKNYNQTHYAAVKDSLARGFAYPGFYVKVTIKDFKREQLNTIGNLPIVLSFMLKHEHKMTVLHGKVQKNSYYEGEQPVNSNELVLVSVGFKRILVEPIYSRLLSGIQKTKYTDHIGQDYQSHYYCSFYHYNYFPPSPFLVFRVNKLNTSQIEPAPILKGELAKCDPMHIILKRIILTGYPYKINKRRATVRYMFFRPGDVKYFKPIEVRTRMGLRGRIQQSLGTHGLMKVFFNDPIKQNDTICMHLYRRMYPNISF